jgi:hypothetical protein
VQPWLVSLFSSRIQFHLSESFTTSIVCKLQTEAQKKGSNLKRFPASQLHSKQPDHTELYQTHSPPLKSHKNNFGSHTQRRTYLGNVTEELKTNVRNYRALFIFDNDTYQK